MNKKRIKHGRKPKNSVELVTDFSGTSIACFDDLPDSALVRLAQIVRDPRYPKRRVPLPFSPATFWRKVKAGTFPKPVKLGERITAWRVGEIREWINAQTGR